MISQTFMTTEADPAGLPALPQPGCRFEEDLMDIIKQAETLLVFDVERGLITEAHVLLGKLVEALKHERENTALLLQSLAGRDQDYVALEARAANAEDNAAMYKRMYERKAHETIEAATNTSSLNDAWPGDPGAAD